MGTFSSVFFLTINIVTKHWSLLWSNRFISGIVGSFCKSTQLTRAQTACLIQMWFPTFTKSGNYYCPSMQMSVCQCICTCSAIATGNKGFVPNHILLLYSRRIKWMWTEQYSWNNRQIVLLWFQECTPDGHFTIPSGNFGTRLFIPAVE